jgi:peptidoglycan/xylan/chitin deacetylase (PgdA/CDA1 family)
VNLKIATVPLLHRLGYWTGLSTRRAQSLPVGRILMFHGVGDGSYPAELFEAHLRYLKRCFEIVPLASLVQRLVEPNGRMDNAVALTFDDGLRNHFTAAYPVLRQLSVPATFFVCPGLIERQCWLWNHEARARLNAMKPADRQALPAHWPADRSDTEEIIGWMKTLQRKEREASEQVLRELTRTFQPTAGQRQSCDVMNWAELRTLEPSLITIGSHTVSHPILPTLSPDELDVEVRESRRMLEDNLGRKVLYFCYPNGALNPAVVDRVRKTYDAAVTTKPGFVVASCDRLALPRIGIADNLPLVAWRMHRPTA